MPDINATIQNATLLRDIIANSADAIVIADAAQVVTYINSSAESLFGHSCQEIIGKPIDILMPEQFRAAHRVSADSFRDSGEQARFMANRDGSIHGLRADGTEFPANVSILKSGSGPDAHLVAIIRDVTEQKRLEDELKALASTDPLTGVLNRRTFLAHAEAEYDRARRYGRPMTFAMIDIDHFKAVNDFHGHLAGDKALCHVAGILSSGLRSTDVLCRWGGEEFALLLAETDETSALIAAQRLRCSVAAHSWDRRTGYDSDDGQHRRGRIQRERGNARRAHLQSRSGALFRETGGPEQSLRCKLLPAGTDQPRGPVLPGLLTRRRPEHDRRLRIFRRYGCACRQRATPTPLPHTVSLLT